MASFLKSLYDDYCDSYYDLVNERFNKRVEENEPRIIFKINSKGMYDNILIKNLPDNYKDTYNCNTCRRFFDDYAGLVYINDDGTTTSLLFGENDNRVPSLFTEIDEKMKKAVENKKVVDIFVPNISMFGSKIIGGYRHFFLDTSNYIKLTHKYQVLYGKNIKKDFKDKLNAAIRSHIEYTEGDVINALRILETNEISNASIYKKYLETFRNLKKIYLDGFYTHEGYNLFVLNVLNAPDSSVFIKNSVLGKMLDDIKAGLPLYQIIRNFNLLVEPENYMRPKAAPSEGNVKEAEKIVSSLGLESALQRRYATLDEIKTIWKPSEVSNKNDVNSSSIFGDLETKESKNKRITDYIKLGTIMTSVEEFVTSVLPRAKEIYMDFSNYNKNEKFHFCGILTQNDPNANPIIMWDNKDERNPFSLYTYYEGSCKEQWNIKESIVKVTAVTNNPACWLHDKYSHFESCIFILEGCKDLNSNVAMSLFPEILIRDLYPVRSTIEAYSNSHYLLGIENATACGITTPVRTTDRKKYKHPFELIVISDIGNIRYELVSWK